MQVVIGINTNMFGYKNLEYGLLDHSDVPSFYTIFLNSLYITEHS